jgi:hypothetical protein
MTAAWLLLHAACCRSAVGQERLQPAAQAFRGQAVRNVLLAPVAARQPIADQIRRHLEPILKVELSFANRAADLNDDERRALVAASVQWFDEFVVDLVKNQDPNKQRLLIHRMQGAVIGGDGDVVDPRESIQPGVAKVVAATLTKEKVAEYERECAKRAKFYREAAVANLVESVDETLNLSTEQRLKITDVLIENWNKDVGPEVEFYMLSNGQLPNLAEMWIRPELNESQRKMLDNIKRNPSQEVFFGVMELGAAGEVIEDIDLDVEAPPAADDD